MEWRRGYLLGQSLRLRDRLRTFKTFDHVGERFGEEHAAQQHKGG